MQPPDPTTEVLLLALSLVAKGIAAGTLTGAFVGAVQIRFGQWHPLWADSFFRWLSYPCYAGLTIGVMVALFNVPARAPAKPAWLVLCIAVAGASALLGSSVVARFLRLRRPGLASKSSKRPGHSPEEGPNENCNWKEKLRGQLFGKKPPLDEPQTRTSVPFKAAPSQQKPTVIPRRPVAGEAARKSGAAAPSWSDGAAKAKDEGNLQRESKRGRRRKRRAKGAAAKSPQGREPADQGRFEKPIK